MTRAIGIRIATLVLTGLAIWEALASSVPRVLPDYALGSLWILRGERALGVLLLLVVLVTIFWRGVIDGQLPLEISREGLKYEAAKELLRRGTETATQAVTEEVDKAISEVKTDLAKVSSAVDNTAAATADAIRQIESKIENIERQMNE